MSARGEKRGGSIIILAYMHRYGWLAVLLLAAATSELILPGIVMILFALWGLLGYRLKWKHIYCAYQSLSHRKMTPNQINWNQVEKKDAYGVPIIFLIIGLSSLIFGLVMYLR